MWNTIAQGIFIVIIVYVINKIFKIYDLLSDVSDDINDIRKKMGLNPEARTKKQYDELMQRIIRDKVYDGQNLEEIKKILGSWKLRKYEFWIKFYLNEYSKKKICPKCDAIYDGIKRECEVCKISLVSTKEHKPSQDAISDRGLSRVEDELDKDT